MTVDSKRILLVIVLYNRRLWDTPAYRSLIAMYNAEVYIHDNSPLPQHQASEFPVSWKYVPDTTNPGLSKAYNAAATYARQQGYPWILLMDQDTEFPAGILEEYLQTILAYPDIKLIVPVVRVSDTKFMSPVRVHCQMARLATHVPTGIIDMRAYSPINSGMAIEVKAFLSVNGYNEKVRLDFSDYQFIERFRQKYAECYVLTSVCQQEFSDIVQTSRQKIDRFILFCDSLANCDKHGMIDKMCYFIAVSKRMLSLSLRTMSLKPAAIFVRYYMKRR